MKTQEILTSTGGKTINRRKHQDETDVEIIGRGF